MAEKELALLQKEQELLDREQTLLVLQEEVRSRECVTDVHTRVFKASVIRCYRYVRAAAVVVRIVAIQLSCKTCIHTASLHITSIVCLCRCHACVCGSWSWSASCVRC